MITTKPTTCLTRITSLAASIVISSFLSGCATPQTAPHKIESPPATVAKSTTNTLPQTEFKPPTSASYVDITGPLTLSNAIARAIQYDREITRLQNRLDEIAYTISEDLRDPELRLSYGEGNATGNRHHWTSPEISDTTGNTQNDSSAYRIAIRFFVPNLWTHSATEIQRDAAYHAARAKLETEKKRVTTEIRLAFARLHYLAKKRAVTENLVKLYDAQQQQIDKLTEAGDLNTMDNIKLSRRHLAAVANLTQVELQYNNAINALAEALCLPSESLEIRDAEKSLPTVDTSPAGIYELQSLMLQYRSDLAALGWDRIAVEAALKRKQREHMPWFRHVQLSYGAKTDTNTGMDTTTESAEAPEHSFRDDDTDSDEWDISTAISIPLYGLNDDGTRLLASQVAAADARLMALTTRARFQLREACHTLRVRDQVRRRYKASAQPLTQKIIATLQAADNTKTLSFEEQSQLYEDLNAAKQLELQLDFNYRAALIKLDKIIGLPLLHYHPVAP